MPNLRSADQKALLQTHEKGLSVIAEMPQLTEFYQAKLLQIQQSSKHNQLKYLGMCSPRQLCEVGIGLKTEEDAVVFMRRIESSLIAAKEGQTKRRPLTKAEKRIVRHE